ncbi:hypothetical protein LBMAG13_03810 [Actinomycetes bacterium]|nr:hypothetical protein LBMAG13_03810 [Actinomycetes bacterium]
MKTMKTLVISAVAVLGLLATTQVANASSHVKATKKQTVKFSVTGDCKDEEEMIEGESKDDCKIVVKISPTTPTRSAILEQLNDDDEWDEVSTAKSKSGKITFSIDATDEDDAWLDGDFTFRVTVKKSGTNKAVESDEYTFTFTPAESTDEDSDSSSGSGSAKQKGKSTGNTKLDSVLDKMDDKNTTFDDNCEKSFGADCKLMFTTTGPNWAKLSAAKWQPMCEKLLKQTAANCKLMYGATAPPPGSNNQPSSGGSNNQPSSGGSNNQPSSGGSNNQPSSGGSNIKITEADIKKACTAAGITNCDSVIKLLLGPTPPSQADMTKLLGSKMDAFFKAMPQQPSSGGSNNQPSSGGSSNTQPIK